MSKLLDEVLFGFSVHVRSPLGNGAKSPFANPVIGSRLRSIRWRMAVAVSSPDLCDKAGLRTMSGPMGKLLKISLSLNGPSNYTYPASYDLRCNSCVYSYL